MRLPSPWYEANEGLAFVVEVVAIALLAWWGFVVGDGLALSLLAGLATPAAAIVLWGLFAAPRARFKVPLAAVLAVKAVVLGGAALALAGLDREAGAAVFAVVALVNTALATAGRRGGTGAAADGAA